MSAPAIRAFGVGKRYLRGPDAEPRLIARFRKRRQGVPVWALRDCTFEVKRGEALGIIGANGAGKSTLLKILSRITRPNEGRAELYGRIGSLLEVGTGFHPELTGRENVFLNGALVGMSQFEIRRNFESIVEFAGVADWIDTPIKRYSSGMKVRLAFAVAAHLEQEIMVIDEVLAVGDSAFRRKCFQKIQEVTNQDRTVLLVSHELPSVATTCTRTIWLEGGRIREDGTAAEVIDNYLAATMGYNGTHGGFMPLERDGGGSAVQLNYVRLLNKEDSQVPCFVTGETAKFAVGYEASVPEAMEKIAIRLTILNSQHQPLAACEGMPAAEASEAPNPGEFVCEIGKLPFVAGRYSLEIAWNIGEKTGQRTSRAADFSVILGPANQTVAQPSSGYVFLDQRWSVKSIR